MEAPLERLKQRLAALSRETLTSAEVLERAHLLLKRALPTQGAVWATLDPATTLFTSCMRFGLDGVPGREDVVFENEMAGTDFNLFGDLARGPGFAAALSLATGGRLEESARYRALKADLPFLDELRIALVSRGQCWGTATLYRVAGEHPFTAQDVGFAGAVAPTIGEGLRLSMVRAMAQALPAGVEGPGVLILDASGRVESATSAATRLLSRISAGGGLPPAVTAVAIGGRGPDRGEAHARVQDATGHWLELHGSDLGGGRVAVIIEEVTPPALATIIVEACGLSPREREVTEQVLRGASTREIAEALCLSEYTVQDHLKAVFLKTGVRSRRELAAFLSDRYYRPQREAAARPGPQGWFIPERA